MNRALVVITFAASIMAEQSRLAHVKNFPCIDYRAKFGEICRSGVPCGSKNCLCWRPPCSIFIDLSLT